MDYPYGIPQNAILDSPYGLAPTPIPVGKYPPLPDPVADWRGPLPLPPPPPVRIPEWTRRPEPPHQTPYRVPAPQGNMVQSSGRGGAAPIIGKDIPVEKLVDIQRKAESSGNYQALNRQKAGNTASGAYQYTDSTWNNYGGYAKAMLAPKEIQDRRFAEDIQRRVVKHNGDMFKALAEHYLPVQARSPEKWREPATFKVKGKTVTVGSVEKYLRHVLKGSPYINQLDAYLEQHG